jgi:hypothetical protein
MVQLRILASILAVLLQFAQHSAALCVLGIGDCTTTRTVTVITYTLTGDPPITSTITAGTTYVTASTETDWETTSVESDVTVTDTSTFTEVCYLHSIPSS